MVENLTGQVIGKYELRGYVGKGAQGFVYRAYDPELNDEDVAIKIIKPEHAREAKLDLSELIDALKRDAQTLRKLTHYNIVRVYEYGQTDDGSAYLAMQYMPGGSLAQRLEKGSLSVEEASRIITQVASALAAAHQEGILHLDVKPGNILLDKAGNAYLSDFGLAKQLSTDASKLDARGTPGYIAPELFLGEEARERQGIETGPQVDIFSLGITLYECLSGIHPFADNRMEYLTTPQVKLPPLGHHRPDLHDIPAVEKIVRDATHKNPKRRYRDVLKFAQAVDETLRPPAADDAAQLAWMSNLVSMLAQRRRRRIFISYQRQSSLALAWLLSLKLKEKGIDPFIDLERLDSGKDINNTPLEKKLFQEIDNCDVFVCVLGEKTLQSEWVCKEIKYAHTQGKPMLPVRQQEFVDPGSKTAIDIDPHTMSLLNIKAVRVFEKEGEFINEAIDQIAKRIRRSPIQHSEADKQNARNRLLMAAVGVIVALVLFVAVVLLNPDPVPPDLTATQKALEIAQQLTAAQVVSDMTQQFTDTQATVNAQMMLDAQAAATNTQITLDTQATTNAQMMLDTQATTDAQTTLDAQVAATNVQMMLDTQATTDAQATANVPTNTPVPTDMPTVAPSPTFTPMPTDTPANTLTPTTLPTETMTFTPSPSFTPTPSPTETMTFTPSPSFTPTPAPIFTPFPTLIMAGTKASLRPQLNNTQVYVDMEVLSIPCTPDMSECPNQVIYIATRPVSNRQYQQCEDKAHICPIPGNPSFSYFDLGKGEQPVINVTWRMANTFCGAIGGRLPTQKEWESAAEYIPNMRGALQEWTKTPFFSDQPVPIPEDADLIMIVMNDSDGPKLMSSLSQTRGFRCVFTGA